MPLLKQIETNLLEFEARCSEAWRHLFDAAKARNEVYFAISLMAEFRGPDEAGWNTAQEAKVAFQEYGDLLKAMPPSPIKMRVGLSFYSHVSEAAGLYEIAENMLRVAGGDEYSICPFQHLAIHRNRGGVIAPNANKIMQALLGHAEELGFTDLRTILLEAFDPDLRNGYAHADYVIWGGEIRLPKRNGGQRRTVTQDEFTLSLNKAFVFFQTLWRQSTASTEAYAVPVHTVGRLNNREPNSGIIICFDPNQRTLSIEGGHPIKTLNF